MQVIIDHVRAAVEGKPNDGHTPTCNAWLRALCDIASEWPEAIAAARRGSRFDGVQDAFGRAAAIAADEAKTNTSPEGRAAAQRIADAITKRARDFELDPTNLTGGPATDLLGRRPT